MYAQILIYRQILIFEKLKKMKSSKGYLQIQTAICCLEKHIRQVQLLA